MTPRETPFDKLRTSGAKYKPRPQVPGLNKTDTRGSRDADFLPDGGFGLCVKLRRTSKTGFKFFIVVKKKDRRNKLWVNKKNPRNKLWGLTRLTAWATGPPYNWMPDQVRHDRRNGARSRTLPIKSEALISKPESPFRDESEKSIEIVNSNDSNRWATALRQKRFAHPTTLASVLVSRRWG